MRKLIKLFGIGLLTGAGTRAGIMLMEAAFPNGLKGFWDTIGTKIKIGQKTKQRGA